MVDKAILADELPQDRFRVVEGSIVNTIPYIGIMTSISRISREMNWVKDYNRYPSRKFEYPFAYLSSSLNKGMKVLVSGCSIDPFSPFLASAGADVYGVYNYSSHDVPWDPENGILRGRYKGFENDQMYKEYLKVK